GVSFEFEPRKSKKKSAKKSEEPAKKISFEGQSPLGKCPRCEGNVFASESDYLCEHSQRDTKPCKFKSGKVVLQQAVEEDQIKKLLDSGRTDFLKGFVSKRGFPFEAALVVEDKGKVGFEFAPREEGASDSDSES
ncbi:topoisomerase C-terminal repeat-containing protein, partial [bacterium]|nr:topoisomerase C-terminal repeat-containing protein [bacterium]